MSQNSNTLILFFEKESEHKDCLLMLLKLNRSEYQQAKTYAQRLNIDITHAWNEDWFNHNVSAKEEYIRIDYDSGTGYDLPLEVLKSLFGCGLKAAALEVFYDQVGEVAQYYFVDGQMVAKETAVERLPIITKITQSHFDSSDDQLEDDGYKLPIAIERLIKDKEHQMQDSKELVDGLLEINKLARESGSDPMELLESALVVRAIGKGLLQGLSFGIITVLLFKGMWLWISLSLILCVVLTLYYVSQLSNDSGEDDENLPQQGDVTC